MLVKCAEKSIQYSHWMDHTENEERIIYETYLVFQISAITFYLFALLSIYYAFRFDTVLDNYELMKTISIKDNVHPKYFLDKIPIIFNESDSFSLTNNVYLLRLIYGQQLKNFFLPNTVITIELFDHQNRCISQLVINSIVLINNHRRYIYLPASSPKYFYGNLLFIDFSQ